MLALSIFLLFSKLLVLTYSQHDEIEGSSSVRRAFFEALKVNQSLIDFEISGYCNIQPSAEEKEYFKECLLENSIITSMRVPWNFEELERILERNTKMQEERRFKITKLAVEDEGIGQ